MPRERSPDRDKAKQMWLRSEGKFLLWPYYLYLLFLLKLLQQYKRMYQQQRKLLQ